MFPMRAFLFAGAFVLVACSSDDETSSPTMPASPNVSYRIDIEDATPPLTANPADDLFVVKLAAGAALETKELAFQMQFTGGSQYLTRDVALTDKNGNGKLDVGESVTVGEGSTSIYGEANVGQRCNITMVRFGKSDPAEGRALATGIWQSR